MEKRIYLWLFVAIVIGIVMGSVLGARPFDPAFPWHPLQQITSDETGMRSVDLNSYDIAGNPIAGMPNGQVDFADNAIFATVATDSRKLSGKTLTEVITESKKGVCYEAWPNGDSSFNDVYSAGNVDLTDCVNKECMIVPVITRKDGTKQVSTYPSTTNLIQIEVPGTPYKGVYWQSEQVLSSAGSRVLRAGYHDNSVTTVADVAPQASIVDAPSAKDQWRIYSTAKSLNSVTIYVCN